MNSKLKNLLDILEDGEGPGVSAMGTAPMPQVSHKGKKYRLKRKKAKKDVIEDFGDEHGIDNDIGVPKRDGSGNGTGDNQNRGGCEDIVDTVAELKDLDPNEVRIGQFIEMEHEDTLRDLYEMASDKISIEDFIKQGSTMIAADHIKEFEKYYIALEEMEDKLKQEKQVRL